MHLLAAHLQQCQRSLCLHPVSELLLLCFYKASLWLRRFLWGDHRLEAFAPSSRCVWSQRPWRNLQIILSSQGFFSDKHLLKFDGLSKFVMSWINFSQSHSDSSKEFSYIQVQSGWVAYHCKSWRLWRLGLYLGSSWQLRGHPSCKKGGCNLLCISFLYSRYIRRCSIGALYPRISLFSSLLGLFHQDRQFVLSLVLLV